LNSAWSRFKFQITFHSFRTILQFIIAETRAIGAKYHCASFVQFSVTTQYPFHSVVFNPVGARISYRSSTDGTELDDDLPIYSVCYVWSNELVVFWTDIRMPIVIEYNNHRVLVFHLKIPLYLRNGNKEAERVTVVILTLIYTYIIII